MMLCPPPPSGEGSADLNGFEAEPLWPARRRDMPLRGHIQGKPWRSTLGLLQGLFAELATEGKRPPEKPAGVCFGREGGQ